MIRQGLVFTKDGFANLQKKKTAPEVNLRQQTAFEMEQVSQHPNEVAGRNPILFGDLIR